MVEVWVWRFGVPRPDVSLSKPVEKTNRLSEGRLERLTIKNEKIMCILKLNLNKVWDDVITTWLSACLGSEHLASRLYNNVWEFSCEPAMSTEWALWVCAPAGNEPASLCLHKNFGGEQWASTLLGMFRMIVVWVWGWALGEHLCVSLFDWWLWIGCNWSLSTWWALGLLEGLNLPVNSKDKFGSY